MHVEDAEQAAPTQWFYDVRDQLKRHVYARAEKAFIAGDAARDGITSRIQLEERQKKIRAAVIAGIGGLPSMESPLNARKVGEVAGNGFKIEKIIFESRPNVIVTANLYIPDNLKGRTGAVLFVSGHAQEAKGYPEYQIVCQHMALAGLVTLAIDPVGQGERMSYWDPQANKTTIDWGVTEHDHAGAQCLPLGESLARYFVHDTMRAVDLLRSRPEVDPERIGVTGNSGGGTQTSLMMLCDPRIAAAAPGTFIMSRKTYMDAGGGQDAEQIWPEFSEHGLDHEDILLAMCPKPVRVLACTGDFFPIEGARRTVQRSKRLWELCGRGSDVGISEDQIMHAYTPRLAKAAAEFFCRALRGAECQIDDSRIKPFAQHEIWCTKGGQVRNEFPDSTFIFETVKARVDELKKSRQALPASERRKRAVDWLRKKVQHQRQPCDLNPRYLWEKQTVDGLAAGSAIWWSHEGIFSHAYVFRDPERAGQSLPVTLAVWDRGTKSLQKHWDWIENTCAAGRAVMVLDVSGNGALLPHPLAGAAEAHFGSLHKFTTDLLFLGDDLASMRVFDTLRALDMIAIWPNLDAKDIHVYAHGRQGMYGRIAAALDERIKKLDVVKGSLMQDWVTDRHYEGKSDVYPVIMRGALQYFDLDELSV